MMTYRQWLEEIISINEEIVEKTAQSGSAYGEGVANAILSSYKNALEAYEMYSVKESGL